MPGALSKCFRARITCDRLNFVDSTEERQNPLVDQVTQRIAVIGAGLAGLACARILRRAGAFVEVFEKDRMIGGRMATTRFGIMPYDQGAQYVTARTAQFRAFTEELLSAGNAALWKPAVSPPPNLPDNDDDQPLPWYVGTPGMASMILPLAEGIRITTDRGVRALDRTDGSWTIRFDDDTSVGPFSAVALSVPAPQAQLLLSSIEEVSSPLQRVKMSPCWVLMVRLDQRFLPDPDVYSDLSETIRWIARNNSKPGRPYKGEAIVVCATSEWSRANKYGEPEAIAEKLWIEACQALSLPPVSPSKMVAHFWRHGLVDEPLGETYIYSSRFNLGLAGDWCLGQRCEHAFESGSALGRAMIAAMD